MARSKRDSSRYLVSRIEATVQPEGGHEQGVGEQGTYRVRDISTYGMCFCSPSYWWPCTKVRLAVHDRKLNKTMEVEGEIRWCRHCDNLPTYRVGVQLLKHCGNSWHWFSHAEENYGGCTADEHAIECHGICGHHRAQGMLNGDREEECPRDPSRSLRYNPK